MRRCDQSEHERLVAGDRAVLARGQDGRRDAHVGVGDLGRLAVGVTGVERAAVGLGDVRQAAEAIFDPVERRLEVAVVEPVDQSEREEVLGPLGVLVGEAEIVDRRYRGRRDRRFNDAVAVERAVAERIAGVVGLLQVARGEGVLVDDQQTALGQGGEVRLERGGVHRHERVGFVAGGENLVLGERDLEAGDAGQRTGGRADFGGEVGQRREVVAEDRGGVGEAVAGQLHAVAGVAREADRDAIPFLNRRADAARTVRLR